MLEPMGRGLAFAAIAASPMLIAFAFTMPVNPTISWSCSASSRSRAPAASAALGGWLANGARLATVIVAVLLTIYKDRIWKPLPSEAENIDVTGSEKAAEKGELRYSPS
jgi:hypothetical protein